MFVNPKFTLLFGPGLSEISPAKSKRNPNCEAVHNLGMEMEHNNNKYNS